MTVAGRVKLRRQESDDETLLLMPALEQDEEGVKEGRKIDSRQVIN